MSCIPVIWWSNKWDVHPYDQWDSGMLHHLFDGKMWPTGFEFESGVPAPAGGHAVVVVAARHHVDDVDAINQFISTQAGVVLILLGDEEAVFPWKKIEHPNIRFWVMMPHPIKHADMIPWAYFFGTGYKHDTVELLDPALPDKPNAWVFAGQSTHARRIQAVDGLRKASGRVPGILKPTKSFTSGMERPEYMMALRASKIAACPSGPVTADTMRLYEALEAGCLPIVDPGPEGARPGFWEMLYGNHPLHVTNDWNSVGGEIEDLLLDWPRNANVVSAWWQQQKRDMARRLVTDLREIGAPEPRSGPEDKVTVIVTTSPIPSHPSPEILLQTILSVDRSMGGKCAEYIVAFDGVRPEQQDMADAYFEYQRDVCWLLNHEWHDVLPVVAPTHLHQAGTLQLALEQVDTPLVLIVEHDTPFSDEPIDWEACINLLDYGALDILRFHHEAAIHPDHRYLSLDQGPIEMMGVPVVRTKQFSARPHLARTDYYRRVLGEHFGPSVSAFIEDKLYGMVLSEPLHRNRIAIYHPPGSIRRTLHTDGRAGGLKFDDLQRF